MELIGTVAMNSSAERKENISMLSELLSRLKENARLYGIYSDWLKEIERINNLLKTPKPKLKVFLVIIGSLLTLFSIINIFFHIVGGVLAVIVAFLAILAIGLLIVLPIVRFNVKLKKYKAFIADLKQQLANAQMKAAEAKETADKYHDEVLLPYISSIVPDKFPRKYAFGIYHVTCILDLITDLRADSIKEAVNLYEEEEFRRNVMNRLANIDRSSVRSAIANERSAEANERSAAANEVAASAAVVTAANTASIAESSRRSANAAERTARAAQDVASAAEREANAVSSAADHIKNNM